MLTGSNVIRCAARISFEMREMHEKESDEFESMNEWIDRWMDDELKPVGYTRCAQEKMERIRERERMNIQLNFTFTF